MRTSLYKAKILEVFKHAHVLSIADVQAQLGKVDFSTVYRNIEILIKEGLLKKIIVNEDLTVFELVNKEHKHDHFICNDCGKVEEIHIETAVLGQGSDTKVTDVIVRGVCGPCCK